MGTPAMYTGLSNRYLSSALSVGDNPRTRCRFNIGAARSLAPRGWKQQSGVLAG